MSADVLALRHFPSNAIARLGPHRRPLDFGPWTLDFLTSVVLPSSVGRLRRNGGHRLRETMKDKASMNEPVIQPKRTRKKFDNAFKQRAVELWLSSGRTATEVAAELGIKAQRLSA